jgi:hypothetical protein
VSTLAPPGSGRRQTAVLLLALLGCPLAAWAIGSHPAGAVERARWLLGAEDALDLHVEPALNAWARGHAGLWRGLNLVYLGAHVPVTGWALIWTWHLRRDRFRELRDTVLRLQALLVVCWIALPTAPPSAVPGSGVRGSVAGSVGDGPAAAAHLLQSPFAAIPSGHVAFALVAGVVFARLGDLAWLRWFGRLYPGAIVAVVLVTGNHLWLDAVAGALAVLVANQRIGPLLTAMRQLGRRLVIREVPDGRALAEHVDADPDARPWPRWRAPRDGARRPGAGARRGPGHDAPRGADLLPGDPPAPA